MTSEEAQALAARMERAGYAAVATRVTWAKADAGTFYVWAETNAGSQAFFSADQWDRDPANPQRTEP